MSDKTSTNLICVTGHTAAGKTAFAARLASVLDGEIISADSRQVYRNMDIGTGKDIQDYMVDGKMIPFHLIDIVDPGYEYNVYQYQKDFLKSYQLIRSKNKFPLLCGGTGLYIEAVLKGYSLIRVPINTELREKMNHMTQDDLVTILKSYKTPHNITDTEHRKRLERAIEIEEYYHRNPSIKAEYPQLRPIIFGIKFDREIRRERITKRLRERLSSGMVEETERLMKSGISEEKLVYYGLEYKYLAWYLSDKINYDEMFQQLNTAIHQFAKRQMTWFRKMERNGFSIHWLDGKQPMEEKMEECMEVIMDLRGK